MVYFNPNDYEEKTASDLESAHIEIYSADSKESNDDYAHQVCSRMISQGWNIRAKHVDYDLQVTHFDYGVDNFCLYRDIRMPDFCFNADLIGPLHWIGLFNIEWAMGMAWEKFNRQLIKSFESYVRDKCKTDLLKDTPLQLTIDDCHYGSFNHL